jgi:glycine cleavage system aminomethyltransferase T
MTAPYKLTPMHEWHKRHGAQMIDVAGWKRVLAYGDPGKEVEASRSSVGICDVTPLSKIDVQGRHTESVLSNLFGTPMPPVRGCVRAVLGDSQGGIPAYVARLTKDRFMALGAAEDRVRLTEQLSDGMSESGCVHVTDVTSAYAAISIAGPNAVELLKRLGPAMLDAVQPAQCLQTGIARVTSIIVRRDWGGLLVFLLLVPRDDGEYVWECIFNCGEHFGIQPFGLTAEGIMTGREARDVAAV